MSGKIISITGHLPIREEPVATLEQGYEGVRATALMSASERENAGRVVDERLKSAKLLAQKVAEATPKNERGRFLHTSPPSALYKPSVIY